jgi:hypothetical protein
MQLTWKIMTHTANLAVAPFKPTKEMITSAENLFLAMALENTIRPIVEAYQRKVFAERTWEVDEALQKVPGVPETIVDVKHAWLMSGPDFAVYLTRCNEVRNAAKLHAETTDHCPLLVAENTVRLARHALCNSMVDVTKIDGATAASLPSADYDHLVDTTLKLLAPFVTNPLANFNPQ